MVLPRLFITKTEIFNFAQSIMQFLTKIALFLVQFLQYFALYIMQFMYFCSIKTQISCKVYSNRFALCWN